MHTSHIEHFFILQPDTRKSCILSCTPHPAAAVYVIEQYITFFIVHAEHTPIVPCKLTLLDCRCMSGDYRTMAYTADGIPIIPGIRIEFFP